METYHARVVTTLLEDNPNLDGEKLTSACLVKIIHELATLNLLLFENQQKKLTDKRRGVIFAHLTSILNLLIVLYHSTDTEVPDQESITEFADEYPADYANDGILCNLYSLSSAGTIATIIYDSDIGVDPEALTMEEAAEEIDVSLAEIYAGVVVQCDMYEIDFDELMNSAVKETAWK